jgi:hypothetical protein
MFYVRQSNCKIMGLLYGWVLMQYLRLTMPIDRQMLICDIPIETALH